jgi:hypothetical protein
MNCTRAVSGATVVTGEGVGAGIAGSGGASIDMPAQAARRPIGSTLRTALRARLI